MSSPTPSPARDARAWITAQAVATGIGGAVALVAGTLVPALTGGWLSWQSIVTAVVSPQLFVWLGAVAVLGALARRSAPVPWAAFAVILAPFATIAATALSGQLGYLASPLGIIAVVWQATGMTGAALIGAISGVVVRRRREAETTAQPAGVAPAGPAAARSASDAAPAAPRDRLHRRAVWAALTLLVAGAALVFALPAQWLDVYFRIGGTTPEVTPGQSARYVWTAAIGVTAIALALVAAIVARRAGVIVLASLALAAALVAAFVFQVPQGRYRPEAPAPAYNDDAPVCFGTTGDCPGG